jgi:hypothetical protein
MSFIRPTSLLDLLNFLDWSADGSVKRLVWLNVLGNYVPGVLTLFGFLIHHTYKIIKRLTRKKVRISPEDDEKDVEEDKDLEKGDVLVEEYNEDELQASNRVEATAKMQPSHDVKTEQLIIESIQSLEYIDSPTESVSQMIQQPPVVPTPGDPAPATSPKPIPITRPAVKTFISAPLIDYRPTQSPMVFDYVGNEKSTTSATSPVDFSPRLATIKPPESIKDYEF